MYLTVLWNAPHFGIRTSVGRAFANHDKAMIPFFPCSTRKEQNFIVSDRLALNHPLARDPYLDCYYKNYRLGQLIKRGRIYY